jgi:hypothetical protein
VIKLDAARDGGLRPIRANVPDLELKQTGERAVWLIRWQYRASESRICCAVLTHTNGWGFSFQVSIHRRMSALSARTER